MQLKDLQWLPGQSVSDIMAKKSGKAKHLPSTGF